MNCACPIAPAHEPRIPAAVNAVTKSGTNTLHGDAFEFLRDSKLNATNAFAAVGPDGKRRSDGLHRDQFGGTLGGALVQSKLFFFGGFQQSNIRQDPSSSTAYVPTAAEAGVKGYEGATWYALWAIKGTPQVVVDRTWAETAKARIRARVEHPFRVIKRQFGYTKVRFKGLAKNTAQIITLFALSNLWMVRKKLMSMPPRTGELCPQIANGMR